MKAANVFNAMFQNEMLLCDANVLNYHSAELVSDLQDAYKKQH